MNNENHINQDFLETVERYLNKTLSPEELSEFEHKLKNDANFKTNVEDVKLMLLGIESVAMEESIADFHKDLSTGTHKKSSVFTYEKYAIAAILVIGFMVAWYLSPNANEKLYNNYFTIDPGLPTVMSTTDNYPFYEAMVNYKQGDYSTAINKWKKIADNKPDNDTLNYFLGVSHLATKNDLEAISYLTNSTKNGSSVFFDDAQFYLALIALKNNDKTKAIHHLQKSNLDKSKELISQLE